MHAVPFLFKCTKEEKRKKRTKNNSNAPKTTGFNSIHLNATTACNASNFGCLPTWFFVHLFHKCVRHTVAFQVNIFIHRHSVLVATIATVAVCQQSSPFLLLERESVLSLNGMLNGFHEHFEHKHLQNSNLMRLVH